MTLKEYEIKNYQEQFTIKHALVTSTLSNLMCFVYPKSIVIINPINGISLSLKNEYITFNEEKDIKNYKFGYPNAAVFPISTGDPIDPEFRSCSISPPFCRFASTPIHLIAACTTNYNVVVYQPPSIKSISLEWKPIYSISDQIYSKLMDPKFNTPIKQNQEIWENQATVLVSKASTWLPFRSTPEGQTKISNVEFQKRVSWMDTQCLDWSPLIHNQNDPEMKFSLLTLGTKDRIIIYKVHFNGEKFSFDYCNNYPTKHWVTSLKYKSNFNSSLTNATLAVGYDDGSVSIFTVTDSDLILQDQIHKPDNNLTNLFWSLSNEKNNEEILLIVKSVGFKLYNPNGKVMSDIVRSQTKILSGISFFTDKEFITTSNDYNFIIYKFEPGFGKTMDLNLLSNLVYLPTKEERSSSLHFVTCTPNKLFILYGENKLGTYAMYDSKNTTSSLKLVYHDEMELNQFKELLVNGYRNNLNSLDKIWDLLKYIQIYNPNQLLDLIKMMDEDNIMNKKQMELLPLINRILLLIKSKNPKLYDNYTPSLPEYLNQNFKQLQYNYYCMLLNQFLKKYKNQSKQLEKYQISSLLMMADMATELEVVISSSRYATTTETDALDLKSKIYEALDTPQNTTEILACPICTADVTNTSVQGDMQFQCPNGCYLFRCSRSCLLLDSDKILYCPNCPLKSYLFQFENDHITQNIHSKYQLPWISDINPNSSCFQCSSFLNFHK
ncbi:hypothetical protein DLAC_05308 [Tieghemostelium lacteum]|uniref:Transcription factor IIIC 90kDa subunit N-terminal domain-containing protein n=1 Tax=Tieghemostelium lacteum TaxID=361077 RepID=A0A151ZJC1_TIELA|nr:hypothetical protein DLAC_05308 [Tieghemostelium lacteum]|eukprot:KYQ93904.1 hypothetical protein DLAC_05308 [Tieghemostelium lacteum]